MNNVHISEYVAITGAHKCQENPSRDISFTIVLQAYDDIFEFLVFNRLQEVKGTVLPVFHEMLKRCPLLRDVASPLAKIR